MFKTIYDTFIKAIVEKDAETVFYTLQNSSIKSIFKMLQNNNAITKNAQIKIVLEDRISIIDVSHRSIEHHVGSTSIESQDEYVSIHVTMPNITQCKYLKDIIEIPADDSYTYLEIEGCDESGICVNIIKTGVIRKIFHPQ